MIYNHLPVNQDWRRLLLIRLCYCWIILPIKSMKCSLKSSACPQLKILFYCMNSLNTSRTLLSPLFCIEYFFPLRQYICLYNNSFSSNCRQKNSEHKLSPPYITVRCINSLLFLLTSVHLCTYTFKVLKIIISKWYKTHGINTYGITAVDCTFTYFSFYVDIVTCILDCWYLVYFLRCLWVICTHSDLCLWQDP